MDLIKNEGQAQIQIIECGPEHDQSNDSIFYLFFTPTVEERRQGFVFLYKV